MDRLAALSVLYDVDLGKLKARYYNSAYKTLKVLLHQAGVDYLEWKDGTPGPEITRIEPEEKREVALDLLGHPAILKLMRSEYGSELHCINTRGGT